MSEPKFRDNVKEIGNMLYNSGKCTVKTIGAFGKGIGGGIGLGLESIHACPTFARKSSETCERCFSFYDKVHIATGVVLFTATDLALVCSYIALASRDYPEVLLIPAATNIFSGLYELARHRVKKRKSLEEKVE